MTTFDDWGNLFNVSMKIRLNKYVSDFGNIEIFKIGHSTSYSMGLRYPFVSIYNQV